MPKFHQLSLQILIFKDTTLFASCGVLLNSHTSTRESNVHSAVARGGARGAQAQGGLPYKKGGDARREISN